MYELNRRSNNSHMAGKHSSAKDNSSFSETKSYEEAVKLMQTGYTEIAKKLRSDVKQKDKIQSKYQTMTEHPIPHNAVIGFIPNVPNAIRNLPQSMISVDRKPQKRKTLSIKYIETGNACEDTKFFIDCGAALLSAVSLVEKSGIQTKIDLGFYAGREDGELAVGTVCIKNYGERYSFQKVSFPLAHPSMFRRIGFKWLETTPVITKDGFSCGYGSSPKHYELADNIKLQPNTYLISTHWIRDHHYSVEEILRLFEVI